NGYSGEITREVWEVGVYPPRLVQTAYGGGAAWSKDDAPSYPTCTMDLDHHRDDCEWDRPSCDDPTADGWLGDKVHFRPIPLKCPAAFGGDVADVYYGKNPKGTVFEAYAEVDGDADHLRATLHLHANDAT